MLVYFDGDHPVLLANRIRSDDWQKFILVMTIYKKEAAVRCFNLLHYHMRWLQFLRTEH